jgi:hypothetical protein
VPSRRQINERLLRLCERKQFALEEIAVRGFYRLIDLQLGHAVQNDRCLRPVFHSSEAIEFLKAEPDAVRTGSAR